MKLREKLSLKSLFALNGGWMRGRSFVEAIENIGVNNVRFIAPLPTLAIPTAFGIGLFARMGVGVYSRDREVMVECKIVEDRYKVKDNYKITLQAVKDPILFASEHYYVSDLEQLIRDGVIKIAS